MKNVYDENSALNVEFSSLLHKKRTYYRQNSTNNVEFSTFYNFQTIIDRAII